MKNDMLQSKLISIILIVIFVFIIYNSLMGSNISGNILNPFAIGSVLIISIAYIVYHLKLDIKSFLTMGFREGFASSHLNGCKIARNFLSNPLAKLYAMGIHFPLGRLFFNLGMQGVYPCARCGGHSGNNYTCQSPPPPPQPSPPPPPPRHRGFWSGSCSKNSQCGSTTTNPTPWLGNGTHGLCKNGLCCNNKGASEGCKKCWSHTNGDCIECEYGYSRVDQLPIGERIRRNITSSNFDYTCIKNQCICNNGTSVADGTSCPTSGEYRCAYCNTGYHMNNSKCEKNVCTCQNGTPVDSGTMCSINGANICKICKDGYTLKNNACVPNTCQCKNGTPVPSGDPSCKNNGDNVCKSCIFRHSLKDFSCIEDPWTIKEGKECVRKNYVMKNPQKCNWTNWSDMYSKCRLPEAGLAGNNIINKVKEKHPNCNWSSITSKVVAPINYSYMFDGCCRGPGATSWELISENANARNCAMLCDVDKDCNAIEINGCLDNEPNCKGKCYHFKGEKDGEITYGGCVDTGNQKCFKKTTNYKITVAEAETITKKESIPPDPFLPTHGPCPLGCTPPWKSEGNCKIVEKNGDIWRECPYKCSTPFGKGCKYDSDCTKKMCGAFYCPTNNGSKCAHVEGEHGKAWSDKITTVTEKPKPDKLITNIGEFAVILRNKNLIPKDISLKSENQQNFVRIGKNFVTQYSKTKHIAIPPTPENSYEHIGRVVAKILGGKTSEVSMKNYSKRLKFAVKNILSKSKLSRSKIKTDTIPKVSTTNRTTNMMSENTNALMSQNNRDGPGRGMGGLIGNYTNSYKPVNDQTSPISNDLVYTFY